MTNAESQWYYSRSGSQAGPVSLGEIRAMVAAGTLRPDDLAWTQEMAEWSPVAHIPLLQPAAFSPSSARPAPNANAWGQPVAQPAPAYAGQGYGVANPSPYAGNPGQPVGPSQQGLAIAGFVLSLIPATTWLGLILSLVALSGMKKSNNFEGRGLAKAGAIISSVILGAGLLFLCLWLTCLGAVVGAGASGS